ncbi:MAG: RNA 2'-phosphotransferase [Planctomycetes bacterium]|nr:RNA 2'-phosphotransferase [Planctomycetota bacterium]
MTAPSLTQLSKLMSLILRHKPGAFDLTLDGEGYLPIADLLAGIRTRMPGCSESDIRRVIETVETNKRRFSIRGGDIRANYGHSTAAGITYPEASPPAELLHGTARSSVPAILAEGLRPMNRQYVHLTEDRELALRIGARHGEPHVLKVAAVSAHAAGCRFYVSGSAFWLVAAVPPDFIST